MKRTCIAMAATALAVIWGGEAFAQETSSAADQSFASRLTLAVPVFSFHLPDDRAFNDHNWGGVLFYALDDRFSLVAGDFINSYRRNTIIAGVSLTPWMFDFSGLEVSPGALAGFDLNDGYRGYDPVSPLLAAGIVKIGMRPSGDPQLGILERLGLMVTVIPGFGSGRSNAFNLALTVRL